MKKILLYAIVGLSSILLLSGCGQKVRVEQNEVAKILGSNGLEDEILKNSTFRLDSCFISACPKLVTLDVTKNTKVIPGNYYMPKSDMEMELELSIQYSVKKDKKSIDTVFEEARSINNPNFDYLASIPAEKLYEIYIKPIIKDSTRQALNSFKIEQVMDNLEETRLFVFKTINKKLKDSPVKIDTLSFSKIGFPELILQKKKEFAAIDTQKATDMKAMAAELEIMAKKLELEKKKAKMQLEVDNIISKQLDKKMVIWGIIQAIQTSAENGTPWSLGNGSFQMTDLNNSYYKDLKEVK